MIRIFFIRHAESVANTKGIYQGQSFDTELSSLGKIQAKKLARRLNNQQLSKVIVSPLKRTYLTGKAIATDCKARLEIEPKIIETNHGIWEGMKKSEIQTRFAKLYKLWQEDPSQVTFPKGEAFKDTVKRVEDWFRLFILKNKERRIAIVTHDNILRVIFCHLLSKPMKSMWEFTIDPAAITIVECSKPVIVKFNDAWHLKDLPNNLAKHAL